MKYAKEFGYDGHFVPILINYMHGHSSHIDILRDNLSMINPVHITYSPTYPSVETGDMHRY